MCSQPDADEQRQREQLDDDHDVVALALSRAPRSSSQVISITMPNAGQVDQDRNAGDVRRGLEQAVHVRVRAEERGAIAGVSHAGRSHADAAQQRLEVVAPRDRDGDVADGVLENEIPADDPRHQLAERRVGVGVGAPGLRNHRRQLRVAERGERARGAEQHEREDQRRAGAIADDHAVRPDLSGRGGADRAEDAGADHRADRQHHQIAGAEHALQRMG